MKAIILILFFLSIFSCKTEYSVDGTEKISKEMQLLNYEKEVYQLLNDAYRYNDKSPIKTKKAFIYKENTLIESDKYLDSKLFQELINSPNCFPQYLSREQKESSDVWKNDFQSFNKYFDQKFITNSRLQFISKSNKPDNEDRFIIEVSAIFFNQNKAIMIINYKNVTFSARLYIKENGVYSSKCFVSDPPSAEE